MRCHDDIGWAVCDEDAWACGIDPHAHRYFLSDFYAGSHPGSFARGAVFQANPRTGDARISGSAASLCGLEAALADGDDVQTAVAVRPAADALQRRLLAAAASRCSTWATSWRSATTRAGPTTRRTPTTTAGCTARRWTGRQPPGAPIPARSRAGSSRGLAEMARVRAAQISLRGSEAATLLDVGDDRVLGYVRRHPRGARLVALAAFADDPVRLPRAAALPGSGAGARLVLSSPGVELGEHELLLPAWSYAWVVMED